MRPLDLPRRAGRALLLALIRLLFRPPRARVSTASSLRKVLVVRTDPRVGNVLLTTPLLRALRRGLPGAQVHLLIAAGKERLVQGNPNVDRLWSFQKRDLFRRPWRLIGFLVALRTERFDAAIEAGHWHAFSFTSCFLTWVTGARMRVGHLRGEAARFLSHSVPNDPTRVNEIEAKLELLKPLGLEGAGSEMETLLGQDPRTAEGVRRALAPLGLGAAYVAVNPGARKPDHRWPPQRFGALIAAIGERSGLRSVVLWGPGEEEIAAAVLAGAGSAAALAPPTGLEELAAVFRGAALVVTNDTGPMHLSVAVGAPTLALFLAEDGRRWAHPGPRFAAVHVREEADEGAAGALASALRLLEERAAKCPAILP